MLPIEAVFESISEHWRSLHPGLPSSEVRIAREKETETPRFELFETSIEEPNQDPSFTDSMEPDTQFSHPTGYLKPRVLGSHNLSLESQSPPRHQKSKTPEVLPEWRNREYLDSRSAPKRDIKRFKSLSQARISMSSSASSELHDSALSTTIANTTPWLERRDSDFLDDSRRSAMFEETAAWDHKAILSLGMKFHHLRSCES